MTAVITETNRDGTIGRENRGMNVYDENIHVRALCGSDVATTTTCTIHVLDAAMKQKTKNVLVGGAMSEPTNPPALASMHPKFPSQRRWPPLRYDD